MAENPEIDILIEAIGGTTTALDLVKKAIVNGKHVITANKALIAESVSYTHLLAHET